MHKKIEPHDTPKISLTRVFSSPSFGLARIDDLKQSSATLSFIFFVSLARFQNISINVTLEPSTTLNY
jgi:hypothetical protein